MKLTAVPCFGRGSRVGFVNTCPATVEGEPGSRQSGVGLFLSHLRGAEGSGEQIPRMEFPPQNFAQIVSLGMNQAEPSESMMGGQGQYHPKKKNSNNNFVCYTCM